MNCLNKTKLCCVSYNSYRHHIFKTEIIRLAQELGLEIMIKHYPSYASKWNPIEHRVFCHVHRVI